MFFRSVSYKLFFIS
jgi:hypothetical protein